MVRCCLLFVQNCFFHAAAIPLGCKSVACDHLPFERQLQWPSESLPWIYNCPHPALKNIFLVLETPYGPADRSLWAMTLLRKRQRRYVRHAECATPEQPRTSLPGSRGSEHMHRHHFCVCLPECSVSRSMATGAARCVLSELEKLLKLDS